MADKKNNSSDKNKENQNGDDSNIFREYISGSQDFIELKTDKHNPFELNTTNPLDPLEQNNNTNITEKLASNNYNFSTKAPLIKLSDHLWRPEVNAEDYLFHFQKGVQYRMIRKLRAGKIRVEATLDLHQMNKEQARNAFSNFIGVCYDQEMRCICVIHGKGTRASSNIPILKNLVNHWLHDIEIILGFCSCPQNMGGTGAVLILLRRNL